MAVATRSGAGAAGDVPAATAALSGGRGPRHAQVASAVMVSSRRRRVIDSRSILTPFAYGHMIVATNKDDKV